MTNKGQSLVIFVLLLPIILILISLVWELGNLSYIQNKYESEVKNIIKYGLIHKDETNIEEKLSTLLDANLEGEKNITIENNTITINIKKEYKTIYRMIFKDKLDLDITYTGYTEGNNIIIKKE